jgi:hypothetical protein
LHLLGQPDTVLARGRIVPGQALKVVNGKGVLGATFNQTMQLIQAAGRPLDLTFGEPEAAGGNRARTLKSF